MAFCSDVAIPECFDLILDPDAQTHPVRTVWQSANEAGVYFLKARENAPEVLSDPLPDEAFPDEAAPIETLPSQAPYTRAR